MAKNIRYILALGLMLLFVITAGCDQQEAVDNGSDGSKSTVVGKNGEKQNGAPEKKGEAVKVYFSNDNATALVMREKKPEDASEDQYTAAVNALIAGSKEQGVISMIPPKTKLRGIKIEKGIAYVNFSKELIKNFNGGSAGEIMLIGSIVNTLTEFKEINAVQIMVEGEIVETISGHMDTSEPFKRFNNL